MKIFDLHADTATVMYERKTSFDDTGLHINRRSVSGFEEYRQCFAVYTDNSGRNADMKYFFAVTEYLQKAAKSVKNLVPVITVEGGDIIRGCEENIRILAENGVKIFGLVWNGENELAYGAYSNNSLGLTRAGVNAVAEMERCGVIPDVSHLSERGFFDITECYGGVLCATHSNARAVHADLRNLTDDQIREIISRKGLIGLNFYPEFLADDACSTVYDILHHAEHILALGGEDVLAMGSDFDGVDILPDGIRDASGMKTVAEVFSAEYGKELCEKIMYGNAMRVLGGE